MVVGSDVVVVGSDVVVVSSGASGASASAPAAAATGEHVERVSSAGAAMPPGATPVYAVFQSGDAAEAKPVSEIRTEIRTAVKQGVALWQAGGR